MQSGCLVILRSLFRWMVMVLRVLILIIRLLLSWRLNRLFARLRARKVISLIVMWRCKLRLLFVRLVRVSALLR